jgi:hypothetical protein
MKIQPQVRCLPPAGSGEREGMFQELRLREGPEERVLMRKLPRKSRHNCLEQAKESKLQGCKEGTVTFCT